MCRLVLSPTVASGVQAGDSRAASRSAQLGLNGARQARDAGLQVGEGRIAPPSSFGLQVGEAYVLYYRATAEPPVERLTDLQAKRAGGRDAALADLQACVARLTGAIEPELRGT